MKPSDHRPSGLAILVRPDRAEAALWRQYKSSGRAKLREELFERYRRFAASLARRHGRRSNAAPDVREDLEQFAYRGLLEAIDRFDTARGAPFLAYATRRIAGSIIDGIGQLDESSAQFRFRRRMERERVVSLTEKGEPDGGKAATEQLSDLVTELALGLMLEAEERRTPSDLTGSTDDGFDSLAWRQTRSLLKERVASLPEPERTVIRQHYLHDLLFVQIAAMLGVSKGRVSQLHKSALARLRKSMRWNR